MSGKKPKDTTMVLRECFQGLIDNLETLVKSLNVIDPDQDYTLAYSAKGVSLVSHGEEEIVLPPFSMRDFLDILKVYREGILRGQASNNEKVG